MIFCQPSRSCTFVSWGHKVIVSPRSSPSVKLAFSQSRRFLSAICAIMAVPVPVLVGNQWIISLRRRFPGEMTLLRPDRLRHASIVRLITHFAPRKLASGHLRVTLRVSNSGRSGRETGRHAEGSVEVYLLVRPTSRTGIISPVRPLHRLQMTPMREVLDEIRTTRMKPRPRRVGWVILSQRPGSVCWTNLEG